MRAVRKLLVILVVLYLVALALLYTQQELFIFPQPKYDSTPESLGLTNFSEVKMQTTDGTNIYGWYAKPAPEHKTIIYFGGNGERLDHKLYESVIIKLAKLGYGVFALEYSGYGKSGGIPSEKTFYEAGKTAIDFLEKQIPAKSIIILGRSIGTGVAVEMASQYNNLGGVILWSPFTSIEDTAANLYWFFPVKKLQLVKYKFDSLSKIKKVTAPLLVIYGEQDGLVAPKFSKELFAAANEPKKIVKFPDANHIQFDNDMVIQEIKLFLDNPNESSRVRNR